MTGKPLRPTKPADSDLIIWELHDQGSDQVTRWLLSGGLGFPPKYCRTKKDVDKAKREAISHAKINKVDVWIGGHAEVLRRWKTYRRAK